MQSKPWLVLDERGEEDTSCTLLRCREPGEPWATAEDTLPQVGPGEEQTVER